MSFQEHHFRNLGRARDHLSETMISLESAVDRMTGDDWIDATVLLEQMKADIGPRLGRLRTNASERFDELTREEGSIEHGGGQRVRTAAACASTALAAGAPTVAVDYARAAPDADRRAPGMRRR